MIKQQIKKDLEKTIKRVFDLKIDNIHLESPDNPEHGNYASNFAMANFKKIKGFKSPLELAEKIKQEFSKKEYLEKVSVLKPGFINFYLSEKALIKETSKILTKKSKYGSSKIGKKRKVIIDYSAPNIARPFGIGHLRSTIIGQAIYNIYEFLGYRAIGDNHLGDWGTQFGKLIYAIKTWSSPSKLSSMEVKDLVNLYIRFHEESEKDSSLDEQGRFWFKKLEDGDKEAKKIWKQCIKISWKEFNRIYDILGIKIDFAFGESFYLKMLPNLIKEAKKLGITKKSQGALVIETSKDIPPVLILKSDGASTYHTRDLATIKFRQKRFKPVHEMIYEVGEDQYLHFKQLFIVAPKFKWGKDVKYTHVAHGMITLPSGRMRTRKGETILLENVLKQTIELAEKTVKQNNPNLSKKEVKSIAKIVGIGAVKYNDLSQHYSKSIVFNWDKMLNLQGNSAPYLQYTYTRGKSILNKSKAKPKISQIKNRKELNLVRELIIFPEIVEKAGKNYSPNLICNYLFKLAQTFNNFYESVPVLKANLEAQESRLALVKATTQVIENGLKLLGIEVPEKM